LLEQQSGFTLLIVEDNPDFRNFLTEALKARFPRFTLATADCVREALDQIDIVRPELIFTDMHLPDGNGLELTRRIRETLVDVAVVVLTSFDFPEYRAEAFRSGADHFLAKDTAGIDDIFGLVESIAASHAAC
jgi:DNA-binding NarL/FixJ family response regulator